MEQPEFVLCLCEKYSAQSLTISSRDKSTVTGVRCVLADQGVRGLGECECVCLWGRAPLDFGSTSFGGNGISVYSLLLPYTELHKHLKKQCSFSSKLLSYLDVNVCTYLRHPLTPPEPHSVWPPACNALLYRHSYSNIRQPASRIISICNDFSK